MGIGEVIRDLGKKLAESEKASRIAGEIKAKPEVLDALTGRKHPINLDPIVSGAVDPHKFLNDAPKAPPEGIFGTLKDKIASPYQYFRDAGFQGIDRGEYGDLVQRTLNYKEMMKAVPERTASIVSNLFDPLEKTPVNGATAKELAFSDPKLEERFRKEIDPNRSENFKAWARLNILNDSAQAVLDGDRTTHGMEPDFVVSELQRYSAIAEKNPIWGQILDQREKLRAEVFKPLKELEGKLQGNFVSFENQRYYMRRIPLENLEKRGSIGELYNKQVGQMASGSPEFAKSRLEATKEFQKTRKPLLADPAYQEIELLSKAQVATNKLNMVDYLDKTYNIAPLVATEAKVAGLPVKDYVKAKWPRYDVNRIDNFYLNSEHLASSKVWGEATKNILKQEFGLSDAQVKEQFSNYGAPIFALPKEAWKILDQLKPDDAPGPIARLVNSIQDVIRSSAMLKPQNFVKIAARQTFSSMEKSLNMPTINAYLVKAYIDLAKGLINAKYWTPEFRAFHEMGGVGMIQGLMDSTYSRNLGEIAKELGREGGENIFKNASKAKALISKLQKSGFISVQFGELAYKLATFYALRDMISKNGGLPITPGGKAEFLASNPREISNIASTTRKLSALEPDPKKKQAILNEGYNRAAFTMMAHLYGDQRDITPFGQNYGKHLMLFYRWLETNPRAFMGLAKNAALDPVMTNKILKGLKIGSVGIPRLGFWIAKQYVALLAFQAMMDTFNNVFHPEIESQLTEEQKRKAHINLWMDKDGKAHLLDRASGLADLQSQLGIGQISTKYGLEQILNGDITAKEFAQNTARDLKQAALSGFLITPQVVFDFIRGYQEDLATGQIHKTDRIGQLWDLMGFLDEWERIKGTPSRPFVEDFERWFTNIVEPDEGKFRDWMQREKRALEKAGITDLSMYDSEQTTVKRNYWQAVRYGLPEKAKNYEQEAGLLGVSRKQLNAYIENSRPYFRVRNAQAKADLKKQIESDPKAKAEYEGAERRWQWLVKAKGEKR